VIIISLKIIHIHNFILIPALFCSLIIAARVAILQIELIFHFL